MPPFPPAPPAPEPNDVLCRGATQFAAAPGARSFASIAPKLGTCDFEYGPLYSRHTGPLYARVPPSIPGTRLPVPGTPVAPSAIGPMPTTPSEPPACPAPEPPACPPEPPAHPPMRPVLSYGQCSQLLEVQELMCTLQSHRHAQLRFLEVQELMQMVPEPTMVPLLDRMMVPDLNDGTWQWEMYGGERRLCLRCGQTEYLRQGVCFNAQCSLAFQKYTAQELGERLLRWGRFLACKQLLFLLYVIGRMCPLKDTPNGSPPKWDYDGGVALYVKCKPSNPLRFPNVDMGFKYSGGLHFGYAFEGAA